MTEIPTPGLGNEPQSKWPKFPTAAAGERPIDRLAPNSPLHAKVLKYLLERLDMAEDEMSHFYNRWQVQEKKTQAYIDLPKWEQVLKNLNDSGEAPKVVSITVPYIFATISTIVTYMIHTLTGRKPMFQVGSYKKETTQAARMMEVVLQYNADHTRLIKHLFQFLQDGELYGVGILRTQWENKKALRTVWKPQPAFGFFNIPLGSKTVKTKEERMVYSGNDVKSIDPFMFFPDPRVPMSEVNRRGEFAFWRSFDGVHSLKAAEAQGVLKWVDHIGDMPSRNNSENSSARSLLSGGKASPGDSVHGTQAGLKAKNFRQIDQGSIEIIPAELGLGEGTVPEKWIFTIGNKTQIIQAQPLDADHDMHPVVVSEPYTMGYGFGQPGLADYLGPTQDTLSWLINSHMDNVRTALNNMFIVDPSMVEVRDMKKPGAGKIIRLKKSAYGQDVRAAIQQLAVADVTGNHIRDFELFMRMGDSLGSVNDNLRGLQDSGGRKTATEVRTSGEAGASRLAAHTRLISAQAIVDLSEQMSINIQQNLEEDFYLDLVGYQGMETPLHLREAPPGVRISPEMLVGDFYFPVNDGTLPIDRVAMLDVWKQIFLAVAQDPELRQQFSVAGIFEFLAELGGAKNLDQFKINLQVAPESQIQGQAQAGNVVPIPAQQTPGTVAQPSARAAGAL